MKKLFTYAGGFLLAAALAFSCKTPESEMVPSVLELSPENVHLSPSSQSISFSLQCDLKWTAALEDDSWGELIVQSRSEGIGGSLLFKTDANLGEDARTNILVIKAGKGEIRREITQDGIGADARILQVSTPGLYGIGGNNYTFGNDGWNHASFGTEADGSIRWRLVNAGTLSVLTLTGPKADAQQGDNLTLHVSLNEKGTRTLIENYSATLLYEKDGTWWYKVREDTYFIIKKEAAL